MTRRIANKEQINSTMSGMPYKLADFDYDAPRELIAQHPLARRDASRLLSLDRATGAVTHETFERFPEHLSAGDVLVINTSRVIKAIDVLESVGRCL